MTRRAITAVIWAVLFLGLCGPTQAAEDGEAAPKNAFLTKVMECQSWSIQTNARLYMAYQIIDDEKGMIAEVTMWGPADADGDFMRGELAAAGRVIREAGLSREGLGKCLAEALAEAAPDAAAHQAAGELSDTVSTIATVASGLMDKVRENQQELQPFQGGAFDRARSQNARLLDQVNEHVPADDVARLRESADALAEKTRP